METNNPMYKISNYSDCFFEYETGHMKKYIEYMIVLIYSGELIIKQGDKLVSVKKGECIFLKYDLVVTLIKKKSGEELFNAAFLGFSRILLYEFYKKCNTNKILYIDKKNTGNIIKLAKTPYIQSLYISLIPYFQWKVKPTEDMFKLKQQEGILSLLLSDQRFYSCLFDFIN